MTSLDGGDEFWAKAEVLGRESGHVVCRCPSCRSRCLVSILSTSGTSRWRKTGGGWPKCKVCLERPRVEPIGDIALVARIRPSTPATFGGFKKPKPKPAKKQKEPPL
jgi:hypothetical protein